jgi:hypothetical protein
MGPLCGNFLRPPTYLPEQRSDDKRLNSKQDRAMSTLYIRYQESVSLNSLEYSLREFGKKLIEEECTLDKITHCLGEQLENWKQERTRYANAPTTLVPVPDAGLLLVLDQPEGRILFTITDRTGWWLWHNRMIKGYLLVHHLRKQQAWNRLLNWQVMDR